MRKLGSRIHARFAIVTRHIRGIEVFGPRMRQLIQVPARLRSTVVEGHATECNQPPAPTWSAADAIVTTLAKADATIAAWARSGVS
jgi:hypothetical protein